jgi:hypothetical protein
MVSTVKHENYVEETHNNSPSDMFELNMVTALVDYHGLTGSYRVRSET